MNSILSIILILLGIVTLYFSFWAFISKKQIDGFLEFSLYMLAVAVYAFGYALEISYTDTEKIISAIKLEYCGISFMAVFAFLFIYKYIKGTPLNKYIFISLFVIPLVSLISVFTLRNHSLFYINPHMTDGKYFPVFAFTKGPIYLVRFIYQQLLLLFSISFVTVNYFKCNNNKKHQYLILIIAQVIPMFFTFLYLLRATPGDIDINPFSSFFVGALFFFSIRKFGFLSLVPHDQDYIIGSIEDSLIILDKYLTVKDFNSAASELIFLKLTRGAKISLESFSDHLKSAINNNINYFNFYYNISNGKTLKYKVTLYQLKISNKSENEYALVITDITSIISLLRKLKLQATEDFLTGIKNRRTVMEMAQREFDLARRSIRPLCVIMVDIDYFKRVNDTYGHIAGDKILRDVATELKKGLRHIDILGRYGGEEFLILCPDTDEESGIITAERLRKNIEKSNINITCSFGVHGWVGNKDAELRDLINMADMALYNAKDTGRNRVCKI